MSIPIYSKYDKVREAVARTDGKPAHGLSTDQIDLLHDRFSAFMPSITKTGGSSSSLQDLFQGDLPKGASWDPRRAQLNAPTPAGGGRQLVTVQTPYQPEFASPDRQQYPVHRILANRYWRLFYKLDPVIGNCVDLYADLPWSNFELTGEGVEGEIRQQYEYMCRETQVLTLLPQIVREFLVVGEAVPHTFFDEDKGIFTYIALHNPDQLEVIDAPFIKMDPILEFIPDDRLRSILTSDQPELRKIRDRMPPELINRLNARQNIPLSSLNATFIPRKLHPYDTRGTSMISRMWRVLMLEDSVFNATIQIARRHACFVAGTQVMLAEGIKNIEDVQIGDKVVAGNGKVETVEAAWQEPPSPTVTVKVVGTEDITCTPNHNFLIWKTPTTCACGCGEIVKRHKGHISAFVNSHNSKRNAQTGRMEQSVKEWKVWSESPKIRTTPDCQAIQKVPASEIRPYDYMLIPRKFDEIKPDCTLEQARLLGYYAAEGYQRFNQVVLTLGLEESGREQNIADDAVNILSMLGCEGIKETKCTPSQIETGRRPTIVVRANNSENLCKWLSKHAGEGAVTKRFSEDVMRWPLEYKKELLKGLYLGDGSRSKCSSGDSYQVAMGLTSRSMIYQTRLILAQMGILGAISANPKKHKHANWNDCWIISSTGADARQMMDMIFDEYIVSPWGDAPEDARKGMKTWVDENYLYLPVQSVTPNNVEVSVYNLTISGDHSYIAQGVHCFNSPLKVAKLGNAATGWIPPPEQEKRLLELLAQAELDPNAWLVYHYGINFETIGTTDKVMSVNREWDIIERIKLVAMGISKCFVKDTLINLASGDYKPVQDVTIGDRVVDKDGKVETVVDAWDSGSPKQLIEIVTKGGKKFNITSNHKFPVWAWPRVCACGCGHKLNKVGRLYAHNYSPAMAVDSVVVNKFSKREKPQRIPVGYDPLISLEAKDIKAGDCLLVPRTFESIRPDISLDQARLLGYYIAEGHVIRGESFGGKAHGDGFEFSLGAHERNTWAKDIVNICSTLGFAVHINKSTFESGIKVTVQGKSSVEMAKWLETHGGAYAATKHLSEDVMRWPLEYKTELLKGMFRGDGSQYWVNTARKIDNTFSREFTVKYATTSSQLARQIQLVLVQLGYWSTLEDKKPSGFGKLPQLNPKISGKMARDLADAIWGLASRASKHEINSHYDTFRVDDRFIYLPVKSVKFVENKSPVYNISVTGSHTYLADNVASCNSFLHGEVSYASSATGLQVFLQRLKSMRMFFEQKWLYPKFFRPIAEINGWIKPKASEVNHRYRIKRSARELEEQNAYIVPKIVWDKSLDPQVNSELINAINTLEGIGVKFSKTTKMAAVGYSFEEETKKIQREIEFEKQFLPALPGAAPAAGGGGGGGGGGGMPPPGMEEGEGDAQTPPGLDGAPPSGVNAPPAPPTPGGQGVGVKGDENESVTDLGKPKPTKSSLDNLKSEIWNDDQFGNWKAEEVSDLISLIETGETDSAFWHQLSQNALFMEAASVANSDGMWSAIDEYLITQSYPEKDIQELQYILEQEGQLMAPEANEMLLGIEQGLPEDAGNLSDSQFAAVVAGLIKKNKAKITADNANFLSGFDAPDTTSLMGDMSDLLAKKKAQRKSKK